MKKSWNMVSGTSRTSMNQVFEAESSVEQYQEKVFALLDNKYKTDDMCQIMNKRNQKHLITQPSI